MKTLRVVLAVLVLVCGARTAWAAKAGKTSGDKLPEGEGLAAKYPGDRGIGKDKDVIFADGFEKKGFAAWGENQAKGDTGRVAVVNDKKHVFFGKGACRMTATRGKNNGGGLIKWFMPGCEEVYARFYVKFAKDAGYVHHFVHMNGAVDRWGSFGKAGLLPAGDHHFTTGIEPWFDWGRNAPPGKWMFYTYWHRMKGGRNGKYWGNGFHPKAGTIPRDKWICMEIRVKLNTPKKSDGAQSVWQDGKLIGDFGGINWRTSKKLKINVFWLMSYVTEKAFKHSEEHAPKHKMKFDAKAHRVWFDQVVVARKYIGPLVKKKGAPQKKGAAAEAEKKKK